MTSRAEGGFQVIFPNNEENGKVCKNTRLTVQELQQRKACWGHQGYAHAAGLDVQFLFSYVLIGCSDATAVRFLCEQLTTCMCRRRTLTSRQRSVYGSKNGRHRLRVHFIVDSATGPNSNQQSITNEHKTWLTYC